MTASDWTLDSEKLMVELQADVSSGSSYLLILTDPDAPTPDNPQFAFWRHWVLPGLQPLSAGSTVVAETKPALTEYLGPGPKDECVVDP